MNQPAPVVVAYGDAEGGGKPLLGFDEVSQRLGFVKKVYSIISVQLILTALMASIPFYSLEFRVFQRTNPALLWLCIFAIVITQYMILCYKDIARTVPTNYITLGVFTAAEAYAVSIICSYYPADLVLMALALTAAVTVSLTLYACTTKSDFTYLGGILFTLACCALVAVIFGLFFRSRMMDLLISIMIVMIYSIYLIYDTQLIIGGDHHYKLSLDDYIIGALIIYTDIILLFLRILRILAILRGGR